jgi:hypothetical protein
MALAIAPTEPPPSSDDAEDRAGLPAPRSKAFVLASTGLAVAGLALLVAIVRAGPRTPSASGLAPTATPAPSALPEPPPDEPPAASAVEPLPSSSPPTTSATSSGAIPIQRPPPPKAGAAARRAARAPEDDFGPRK